MTEKRKFRAPTSGDPREIELAFMHLNTKIEEITTKIDTAFGTQETDADAENARITAARESNTTLVAVNTTSIATNKAADAAAIAQSAVDVAADYDGKLANKVDITAVTDATFANPDETCDTYDAGLGTANFRQGDDDEVMSDIIAYGWNETLSTEIDGDLDDINDRIESLKTKINAVCAIIRND